MVEDEDKKPTVAQLKLQTPALIPMYQRNMDITEVVIVTLNRRHPAPPVATNPTTPAPDVPTPVSEPAADAFGQLDLLSWRPRPTAATAAATAAPSKRLCQFSTPWGQPFAGSWGQGEGVVIGLDDARDRAA